jgi:hypothetical protein
MIAEDTGEAFEALLNRLVDGLASAEDEQVVAAALRSDPAARRAYRELLSLHAALHWDYVAAVLPERTASCETPVPWESVAAKIPGEVAASAGMRRWGWFAAFVSGVVVASVAAFVVAQVSGPPGDASRPTPATVAAAPSAPIAALLVDEAGAEFVAGRAPDGVQFGPGDYELRSGIVHVRFAQGADVVLAGPARLAVQDAQHVRLSEGRIRVTAPPTAKGFTVATRAADYVDLGTEFGLRVDPGSGASDLYVFDGQVNVHDARSGKVLSEVVGGESTRFVDGASAAAPAVAEDEFPTPGAIGLRRWEEFERELRRDPGLLAYFPFRRTADETRLANVREGSPVADGRISGARWVSGRWPGKEALLFDRDADCVQLDVPSEYRELSIAAWLKVERLDFELNAILNSDGYESGDVHLQMTRQGHPRGGVAVGGPYTDQVLGNPVPLGRWTHVASVLSAEARTHRIYVNGALARERRWEERQIVRPGPCRLGDWLPKHPGESRGLRGRVDELALWNRALSEDEVQRLVEAGRPGLLWNEGPTGDVAH